MADFGADTDLEGFRGEARSWLEANFPASLAHDPGIVMRMMDAAAPEGELGAWKAAMGAKGWGTPTWPKEYGGGGLTRGEARVLAQEMGRLGAFNPLLAGMGVTMIGPTILDYGTEEQKRRHIPPIARGEARWCVGYSEPNAGSDLASLQMRCVDDGDHWTVNGQKIWTSGAQYSDWCGALVRTDPAARKHDGISFLLIAVKQAGVETRPIALIAGASPFCETFFTDARAAKDDLLGEINQGWSVGKRLLQHERASQTGALGGGGKAPGLADMARRYVGADAAGRLADADLRARLAAHAMDARAHGLTLARAMAEAQSAGAGGDGATNAASVLKNSATAVAQARAELTLEILGAQGLGWEGEAFAPEEIEAVRGWLSGKAMSIYGGSAEIQNNIIAKRILGLPETTQAG